MKKKFLITEIEPDNNSDVAPLFVLVELLAPLGVINFLITGYFPEIIEWNRFFLWLALMIGMYFIMKLIPIIGLLYSIFTTFIYFLLIWYGTNLLKIELLKWILRIGLFLFVGFTMYIIAKTLFWDNISIPNFRIKNKITSKFKSKSQKDSYTMPSNSLLSIVKKKTLFNVYIASAESDIII